MKVVLNGQPKALPDGLTLSGLLTELGLEKSPVALELNREVVPRTRHADTPLRDGDRVEIVTLVGGG